MKTIILILAIFITQISMGQDKAELLEIKSLGKYTEGHIHTELLPNGTRRWLKTSGFNIIKLKKGSLKVVYIQIDNAYIKLEEAQEYLVTIKISRDRFKELKLDDTKTMMTYQNPIGENEIIKVVKKV